ncbi:polygalacturonase QRT3-like, partial [Malania oleifera]|uniref:polygalacturonase QRT3-like n=1 Tax=Malania oleifera TaxID=397392 RepID=UPI0025ADADE8
SATPSNHSKILVSRVFYPILYGADPTGVQDSSDAILNCVNGAVKEAQTGAQLMPGVNDFGGAIIDFQGGNFKLSKPIRIPSGVGNLVLQSGSFRASSTFPGDRYLLELWSPNSRKLDIPRQQPLKFYPAANKGPAAAVAASAPNIYYEDITVRDFLFDSSFRGGGILVVDSVRTRITTCFFIHFTLQAILVVRGHETFVSNTFIGQRLTVGGDPHERDFSGTGIDLASNDNAVTDVVIFSAAIGILLRGGANMITGVHCYNKATAFGGVGILIKLGGLTQTRIDNCYLDYTGIVTEDPVHLHITNGFFLGDANVVIKSVKGQISGLMIADNIFRGNWNRMIPIVKLEGKFTDVNQVVIDRNDVTGMALKSTVGRLTVAGNGTQWVADFSPVLVFPNMIYHFQYSLYARQGVAGLPAHAVTEVWNNRVMVQSNAVIDAVVSVAVDQYNMVGEEYLLN